MATLLPRLKNRLGSLAACLLVIGLMSGGFAPPSTTRANPLSIRSIRAPKGADRQAPGIVAAVPPPGIGDAWVVTARNSIGCGEFDSAFDTFSVLRSATTYSFETVVSTGPDIYMDGFYTTQPISPGDNTSVLYGANDRGRQTKDFPLPAGIPLTLSLTLFQGLSQTPVYRTVVQFTCDTSDYQVLASFPLSPNQPVLNFNSLSGNGCQAGDLTLHLFATLDENQEYLLDGQVFAGNNIYMDYYQSFKRGTGSVEFALSDANDRGLQTNLFPLPSQVNLAVRLILRSSNGRPLYQTDLLVDCSNSFSSLETATPLQPTHPAATLVDLAFSGCASGQAQLENTLWIEQDSLYYYEILVQNGSNVYMDRYFATAYQDPFGYLPKPGINSFALESANDRGLQNASFPLPAGTPVQVKIGLYDFQQRPLYQTTFDYDCAQAGTISNIVNTAFTPLYLPQLSRP